MARALSTALSDLVLALSALNAAIKILIHAPLASAGFCIIAIAAALGTVKFALGSPPIVLVRWHKYFSWLSKTLGMSLIASSYHRQEILSKVANGHLALGLALAILGPYLADEAIAKATELVSSLAVLSIICITGIRFNVLGLIGALLYAVSGLVIGVEGTYRSVPRVDLFHYALAVGNIALLMGLNGNPIPIFYRGK
jgi:hypothetical protein